MWKVSFGRCVHRGKPNIEVWQNISFRWLQFDKQNLQTLIHRRRPERPELYYIKPLAVLAAAQPGSTLLLGLGGGAVVHYLSKYMTQSNITAVEYSESIIEIAYEWFMLSQVRALNIVHDDALHFLQSSAKLYNHILVDLFAGNEFPEHCKQSEFFKLCKKRLTSSGFLAVNLANAAEHFSIFQMISTEFGRRTLVIPIPHSNNMVILASKENSMFQEISKLGSSLSINAVEWLEDWGYIAHL